MGVIDIYISRMRLCLVWGPAGMTVLNQDELVPCYFCHRSMARRDMIVLGGAAMICPVCHHDSESGDEPDWPSDATTLQWGVPHNSESDDEPDEKPAKSGKPKTDKKCVSKKGKKVKGKKNSVKKNKKVNKLG